MYTTTARPIGYANRKPILLGDCKRDIVFEAIVNRYIENGWEAAKSFAFGQWGIPKSLFGDIDEDISGLFGGNILFDKMQAAVNTAFDMWEKKHADAV